MNFHNIDKINSIIEKIPCVNLINPIKQNEILAEGKVSISNLDGLNSPLEFDIIIYPQYPLKNHESESIKFVNRELIKYNHVMGDGSICIHTMHSYDLKKKLYYDFISLKNWIKKYYINKSKDQHYEHIIIKEQPFQDLYYAYLFTDLDYSFKKGDFGQVDLTLLNQTNYKEGVIKNHIIQKIYLNEGLQLSFKWNDYYKKVESTSIGIFIFTKDTPAHHKRFAYTNWLDFKDLFSDSFLNFLYNFKLKHSEKYPKAVFPIFIGYETIEDEIHWIASMCRMDDLPIKGSPFIENGKKVKGKWISELIDKEINWSITRNSSYKYFFGRGAFCNKIVNSKTLIIGIGAIGSMVAKTLVKCGVKNIDLVDYDTKEPENVCRSEYYFSTGLTNKTEELMSHLSLDSPFANIRYLTEKEYFEYAIKIFHKDPEAMNNFENMLSEYDLIIDCSTDDDLMYILSNMNFDSELINLSITNHAKNLVCAFHPNTYRFVNNQFRNILENNIEDLYNPTGCWSPTFKASYNDINTLVQLALKHINILFREEKVKNNFTITMEGNSENMTQLIEY